VSGSPPGLLHASLGASPEYTLDKCLRERRTSELWTAVRAADGQSVLVKAYREDVDRPRGERSHAERQMLRALAGPGVPAVLDLLPENPPVLVTERPAGVPLQEWLACGPLPDPRAFLEIALQLADVLIRAHDARIIHRDLSPANVWIDPDPLRVALTDLDIAQPLGATARRSASGTGFEFAGTPQYVAPEQTGWINRGCDFRSDLYSLGATLYHVLTGRPPFEGTPTELVHAHIARVPPDPVELRSGIPVALARLVMKLLRKEPEERYQSARSLRLDLVALREQLAKRGALDADFELGSADAPERPRFTRTLHGRDAECRTLEQLYARAAEVGLQAILIRGEPGIGKTALVETLRPRIAEQHGYLVMGKFEMGCERPYSAWIATLESLAQQLLMERDARLEQWRRELREGLGSIARVLVDLAPDLGLVLVDAPPVPPLGPSETQARLALALRRLLQVCARPEHPLLLFLDDLQWSDAGSRALLEEVLCGDRALALLLIAAQRGEVADDRLAVLLEDLKTKGVELTALHLPPLSDEATVALLAEVLRRPAQAVRPLAALIARKTANVPLLVRQFVDDIHARGLLRYEPGLGWTWDPERIASADIPEGAVALMTSKIHRLGDGPRELLEFVSCVSAEFDLDSLCELGAGERAQIERHLYELCDAGLLAPSAGGFRLAHDRIREAAQSLLSRAARARLHYDTAFWLLSRIPESQHQERVFEIVEHLNRGLPLVREDQRLSVVRLNFLAGSRALAAGAAGTAHVHFEVACKAFQEGDWSAQPELAFELHVQSAESAFQCGSFEQALQLLDALDRRSLAPAQSSRVAIQRSRIFSLTQQPEATVAYTLSELRKLGIHWPLYPRATRAYLEMLRVLLWLRWRGVESFFRPAAKLDPDVLAPLLVMNGGGAALGRVDLHLVALANCLSMRTQLRHGAFARPAFSLAAFASLVLRILDDPKAARQYADFALEWTRRSPDPLSDHRTAFQVHSAVDPWLMSRRKAVAELPRIAEAASEMGDPEFANYARFLLNIQLALAGDPLPVALRRLQEHADQVARSDHRYPEPSECHAVLRLLLEPDAAPLEQRLQESAARITGPARSTEPYVRTLWLLVLCVRGHHELALDQSNALGERLFRRVPHVHVADHTFLRGVACAALAAQARGRARWRLRRDLRRQARRLRHWAGSGPDFVHMARMLDAELAWLRRNHARARDQFAEAAQLAVEQGFVHHAAFAQERRARLLSELRRDTEAAAAQAQAVALYRQWGAETKAIALERARL
jgi:predicted ATPase